MLVGYWVAAMGTGCTGEVLGGLGLTGVWDQHWGLQGYGEIASCWEIRESLGCGCTGEVLGGPGITGSTGGLLGGLEWGLGALRDTEGSLGTGWGLFTRAWAHRQLLQRSGHWGCWARLGRHTHLPDRRSIEAACSSGCASRGSALGWPCLSPASAVASAPWGPGGSGGAMTNGGNGGPRATEGGLGRTGAGITNGGNGGTRGCGRRVLGPPWQVVGSGEWRGRGVRACSGPQGPWREEAAGGFGGSEGGEPDGASWGDHSGTDRRRGRRG